MAEDLTKEQEELQYFPFYWRRFMDGVRGENEAFVGTYAMLLCRQAEKGRITDIEKVSRWMGGTPVQTIEEVLNSKFKKDAGGYYNEVLERVLGTVENKIEDKKSRAKNAAKIRWERENGVKQPDPGKIVNLQTPEKEAPKQNKNADAMHMQCTCNADALKNGCICNANKSKLNKIKLNKSKVVVVVVPQPPPFLEFKEFCKTQEIEDPEIGRIWHYYQTSIKPESEHPHAWRKKDGTPIDNWKQHIVKVWTKNRKANVKSSTSKNVSNWRTTTQG